MLQWSNLFFVVFSENKNSNCNMGQKCTTEINCFPLVGLITVDQHHLFLWYQKLCWWQADWIQGTRNTLWLLQCPLKMIVCITIFICSAFAYSWEKSQSTKKCYAFLGRLSHCSVLCFYIQIFTARVITGNRLGFCFLLFDLFCFVLCSGRQSSLWYFMGWILKSSVTAFLFLKPSGQGLSHYGS